MATEFILVNPISGQEVKVESAKKIGHIYLVEDENGNWSNYDGTRKSVQCLKLRKTPFKDKYGIEVWEDDVIRINERKARIVYYEGKFYFEYLYTDDGFAIEEMFKKENLKRLYANDMKKSEYIYSDYRETGDEEPFTNFSYYEDVIVNLNNYKNDKEEMLESLLEENPKADIKVFENFLKIEIKKLEKLKKLMEINKNELVKS